jgi:hypothetical protein
MTTPQESRSHYLESVFTMDEVLYLEQIGLAQRYVEGELSIDDIYIQLKDQGI